MQENITIITATEEVLHSSNRYLIGQALINPIVLICIAVIIIVLLSAIILRYYEEGKLLEKEKERPRNINPFGTVKNTYLAGIGMWILISIIIVVIIFYEKSAWSISWFNCLLLIPFFGLIAYLIWNMCLGTRTGKGIKGMSKKDKYDQEVNLIEFVERHTNYLIFGIAGIFTAAQFWLSRQNCANLALSNRIEPFYLFMILSLSFSVCGVLPIIWSPKGDYEHLEWLRNYKTVWYGYSIYYFFAGILSLVIAFFVG